jgi:hypothetical protein
MNLSDVSAYMIAAARTGKSFFFTRWIVSYLLPETELTIYTNLPLNVNIIADHCVKKHGMDEGEVKSRLQIIPRETELHWKNRDVIMWDELTEEMQESFTSHNKRDRKGHDKYIFHGPWHYFFGKPLKKSIVIIDEIHNFCGCDTPKPVTEAWRRFLGELGHEKGIFRCMTQDAQKLADCIKSESASIYRLENTSQNKDPLFKITVYDWQMLANAFLFIPFRQCVICQEEKKDPLNPRAKKVEGVLSYLMGEPYFSMYDSFNKPIEGSQKEEEKAEPFETVWQELKRKHGNFKGRFMLVAWFVEKNAMQLLPRLALLIFALHVILNFSEIMLGFVHTAQQTMKGSLSGMTGKDKKPDAAGDKERGKIKKAAKDKEQESERIVAMTKTRVFTADGKSYGVGDKIGGKRLMVIDYKNRKVKLDENIISPDL